MLTPEQIAADRKIIKSLDERIFNALQEGRNLYGTEAREFSARARTRWPAALDALEESHGTIEEIRNAVREWIGQRGHEACWYYPEIFLKIGKLLGIEDVPQAPLVTREEFVAGCTKFAEELYKTDRSPAT